MKSVSIGSTVKLDVLFAYHVDSKSKERAGLPYMSCNIYCRIMEGIVMI